MPITSKTKTCVETSNVIELGAGDIRALLSEHGFSVPASAEITVRVPSGGGWSGATLDVGADTMVTVAWTERTEEA